MPFGKKKGTLITELLYDYIDYIVGNYHLKHDLKLVLLGELYQRDNAVNISESKVKSTYKQMALKYHPDRGGSNQQMQVINEFYQLLTQIGL